MKQSMSDYIEVVNFFKPENLTDVQKDRITRATIVAHRKKIDIGVFSREVKRFFEIEKLKYNS